MEESVCIICDERGDKEIREIQKAAINNLVESSKKRCDQKYKKFQKLNTATIHRACQDNYNRESAIKSYLQSRHRKSVDVKQILKRFYIRF